MQESFIRDIPAIKQTIESINSMATLKKAMPIIRPILKIVGLDTQEIDKAFEDLENLRPIAQDLAQIPDQFNDLFAERGWIIYDDMNFEVAKSAIKVAETSDIDAAEKLLVDYYSVENVRCKLQTLNVIQAFHSRMPLAEKALIDYQEERYHACVPVVLALLDGLVNELNKSHRGFFSEDVTLTAWNSMAAHSRGLNVLIKLFNKGRRTTRTEQIAIPYRNGIMHGMDLGYDNKIVAAKSWAALFATREWALKVEKGQTNAPPEEPKTTWAQLNSQLKEISIVKERLNKWKPRVLVIGTDLPETGMPEDYGLETPENKLVQFLYFWIKRNYGCMAKCIPSFSIYYDPKMPAIVRKAFESRELKSFEIKEVNDLAPAVTEIKVKLIFFENNKELIGIHNYRLVNFDLKGTPMIRNMENTKWSIMNWGTHQFIESN